MADDNGRLRPFLKNVAPEGFRELTPEELSKTDEISLKVTVLHERIGRLDQQIRAAEAEIKATKLEKENVGRGMMDLRRQAVVLNKSLGIENPEHDRKVVGGVVYIRVKIEAEEK